MSVPLASRKPRPEPKPESADLRAFSFKTVSSRKGIAEAGYQLWVDAFFLESRSIEMAFEEVATDEVGIDLYIPSAKLERSKEVPVYQNVRLETGRGGIWITPTFVVALYASDAIPGYCFVRLSERTGSWIKVQGTPGLVSGRLGILLGEEPGKALPGALLSPPPLSR